MVKRAKGLHLPREKKEYRLTYRDGSSEIILTKETLKNRICREDLLKIDRQIFGLRYDSTIKPPIYKVIKKEWEDITGDIKKEYEYLCSGQKHNK